MAKQEGVVIEDLGSNGGKRLCSFEVCCESTDVRHGIILFVHVLHMLPVSILHSEVTYLTTM
jgi:hypothetical protein